MLKLFGGKRGAPIIGYATNLASRRTKSSRGLSRRRQTVETVSDALGRTDTSLKRGVNEMALGRADTSLKRGVNEMALGRADTSLKRGVNETGRQNKLFGSRFSIKKSRIWALSE